MLQKFSNHPHICGFLGVVFDQEDDSIWQILDYYEHGSLLQYLKKKIKKDTVVPLRTKYT
eukprot:UN17646